MKVTAEKLADTLKALMKVPFGGKPNGRYIIERRRLAELAGRKTLREPFLGDLQDAALEIDLVIVNLDTCFSIQDLEVIERHRSVPPSVIQKIKL